ncbi:class I SAM-dependent methyltransferase [Gemella sp. GH3]|uniref:class I SAM-dependent methyltransferase n=1 Tax=unclassified Gemella TaxID=2624949 RepID=UPI0015CF89DE|nr:MULTISPECIES: methyltransferase [unclassified Gemella]MBF0713492.1 class I SAM-dependent methyltransferase [Gemella sp. GH3.1]NYS50444.1 class I SAM-dependent methyltransferase [Gemella sp. GH3]
MEHYYTNKPNSNSNERKISGYINDKKYYFYTDNGVFSKGNIDFGTKTMLENFSSTKEEAEVCDLGCGYGVVTIFLSTIYKNYNYTMIDINSRSLLLAQKNIQLNNIESTVKFLENNALDNVEKNFDIILTNPPIRAGKEIVHKMIKQSYNRLNYNGELWVVIQKKQGMASCKKLIQDIFSNVEVVAKNKGYYILKSIKKLT